MLIICTKKNNFKLGILSKIKRSISESTAAKIDKTMVRPHLKYIDFVVDSCSNDKLDKIDELENRALRRIEYCMRPERLSYEELRIKK